MRGQILILTCEAPQRPGGVERFVGFLARGLGERGYEVRVFHRENCCRPALGGKRPGRWKRLIGDIRLGVALGRQAAQAVNGAVRMVLSNGPVGWYPIKNGPRQAHVYHGTYRGQAEAIRPFITRPGYWRLKWFDSMVPERLAGRGKLCLSNSGQTRDEVERFFGHRSEVTWCPLHSSHFRPLDRADCRRKLGLPLGAPVGLFVGSTHPMKGFPIVRALVEAFPQVRWMVAVRGEAPEVAGVTVLRDATYELLPLLYNAADFSLCPSLYEPFGYVVAEALACGTPVIASPGGASRLFLQGGLWRGC